MKVRTGVEPIVSVRGKGFEPATSIGFLRSAGGTEGLEKRISKFQAIDDTGEAIETRQLQPGEYLAERAASGWSYEMDLAPLKTPVAAAHTSWVGQNFGLLMAADLLPLGTGKGPLKLNVVLPSGWDMTPGGTDLELNTADDLVIMIGKSFARRSAGNDAVIAIAGGWHFSSDEAAEMVDGIIQEYSRVFDGHPDGGLKINILPFPVQANHGTWQAETRGSTVTIVAADMAFRTQSLQRVHEQLRHELFHIWVPNGVNLTGQYDWFYEGFALYQSLKTAVAVNRISFSDMTSTLSRAHSIDRRQKGGVSLLEASRNRWAPGGTEVYARGMFVAFLTDIAILTNSAGKRSVEDLLHDIYRLHSDGEATEGNHAILEIMEKRPELKRIVDRYIRGGEAIDEADLLKSAGFEIGAEGLKAAAKPGGRQKTILNRLGYNNWRRSPKIQK